MLINMPIVLLFWIISFPSFGNGPGFIGPSAPSFPDKEDTSSCYQKKIAQIEWNESRIQEGIIQKEANVKIFDSQQAIFFVEIDTSTADVDYSIGMSGELKPTSEQAKENNALVAINASFFYKNDSVSGSSHFLKLNDETFFNTDSSDFNTLATGVFSITNNRVDITEWTPEKEASSAADASHALVAGPIIIEDDDTMKMWNSSFVNKRHPRSFAAFCNGNLILGVVDGRDPGRADGMSLHELRTFARGLECSDLLNLDGGGSSTLYIEDKSDNGVINKPSDGSERPVKSIIYLK
ncbi:MAG: phosphodiester glycosidase family protein [Bacteroidota bacterium]